MAWAHYRCATSPLWFNPLWLIQWLSATAVEQPSIRKQSMQLTVAARATRETSRPRRCIGDASQQLPEPLERTGEASTQIERTQRRCTRKGKADNILGEGNGRRGGQRGAARGGWSCTRIRFDLRRVVQSIALQLRTGMATSSWHGFTYTGCFVKTSYQA